MCFGLVWFYLFIYKFQPKQLPSMSLGKNKLFCLCWKIWHSPEVPCLGEESWKSSTKCHLVQWIWEKRGQGWGTGSVEGLGQSWWAKCGERQAEWCAPVHTCCLPEELKQNPRSFRLITPSLSACIWGTLGQIFSLSLMMMSMEVTNYDCSHGFVQSI